MLTDGVGITGETQFEAGYGTGKGGTSAASGIASLGITSSFDFGRSNGS